MTDTTHPYLEPTQDSGRDVMMRAIEGEVVMLNLLRFRDIAWLRSRIRGSSPSSPYADRRDEARVP